TLVSSGGEVLQTASGSCTTVINIGPGAVCAVNSPFTITLASMQTTTIGTPLTDTTHPLTALGLVTAGSAAVVFASRFENLFLDANEQAGECGLYQFSEELSGYRFVNCIAATDAYFAGISGAASAPSIGNHSNAFMEHILAGSAFRKGSV